MMIKHLFSVLCLFGLLQNAFAQEELFDEQYISEETSDSVITKVGTIPESLDADVDSLLRSWHVQYFSKQNDYCHDDAVNLYFPDTIYMERLERLPRLIHLPYNDVIRDCIDLYASRRRNLVRYMLGMADYFFPMIEQVLDKHGLPIELKYLAVVESALNPIALSRVGACGLWQFMLPTGKSYGLEINSLVDERRDPVKSTEAACKYFEDMYKVYGDWNLVLAAYNCGPGNVNKAIKRSGGKTDFWEIFPYLPKETRSYVPLFVAANYIMNYYCDHNICPLTTNLPLATDTIMVNRTLHLQQVSDILSIDLETLRAMNPQYKRDIIPGHWQNSVLRLPAVDTYAFVDKEDTVYTHRYEELLANYIVIPDSINLTNTQSERIIHRVQPGESIFKVADKYGVTPKDIRKWNSLKSNHLAKGTRLRLYIDNGGVLFTPKAEVLDVAIESGGAKKETAVSNVSSGNTETQMYKVKSGDSLYSIAHKYPGVSIQDIKKANNLSDSSIKPGQLLKIPVV